MKKSSSMQKSFWLLLPQWICIDEKLMWCEYMKLLDKEKIEDSVMWSKKKELGKELEEMCNLSQYIKEKGIMQGRKEGRKQGIVVGVKKGRLKKKWISQRKWNWKVLVKKWSKNLLELFWTDTFYIEVINNIRNIFIWISSHYNNIIYLWREIMPTLY